MDSKPTYTPSPDAREAATTLAVVFISDIRSEPGDPVSVSELLEHAGRRVAGAKVMLDALRDAVRRGLVELDHYESMQLRDRRCWLTRDGEAVAAANAWVA